MAWTIDPAHTTVGFSARHMGLSTVRGRFTRFGGEVEVDPRDLTRTRGRAEIETASVDTGNADRDAHLKGADFFDVERCPKIVFEVKRVTGGSGEYRVFGDLTIKDVTREVELEYEHAGDRVDPFGNRELGGDLSGAINRSDWGLTWNVALEAGGFLVSDRIKIEVEGQLAETPEAVREEVSAERGAAG